MVQDGHARCSRARRLLGSMFKGNSSKKGLKKMVGIVFVSKGATNQVDCRATMVVDMIAKTKPLLGDGSTFLAKREC
jgi:hypothetical protein